MTTEDEAYYDDILADMRKVREKRIVKRGRPARLSRDQVEYIRGDQRKNSALAEELGVSPATIARARTQGYVTADEDGAHSYSWNKHGRLTDDDKQTIAADPSPAAMVAKTYNVSQSYVYAIRREFGMDRRRQSPLPPEVMNEIITSELPSERLASLLGVSIAVVEYVRDRDGKE